MPHKGLVVAQYKILRITSVWAVLFYWILELLPAQDTQDRAFPSLQCPERGSFLEECRGWRTSPTWGLNSFISFECSSHDYLMWNALIVQSTAEKNSIFAWLPGPLTFLSMAPEADTTLSAFLAVSFQDAQQPSWHRACPREMFLAWDWAFAR